MLVLAIALVAPYTAFLLWLILRNAGPRADSQEHGNTPDVCLVIPVRNEAQNLKSLLPALAKEAASAGMAPLRLILVDDHSTDETARVAASFTSPHLDLRYLPLPADSGKKAALRYGISATESQYILTTDGDCLPQPGWLASVCLALQSGQPDLLILPVRLTGEGLFPEMQRMEFAAIMAVTEGFARALKPVMCNGANLAFSRRLWNEFEASRTDQSIPSGDDMFLLQFAKAGGYRISHQFASGAFVSTAAVPSLRGFFSQRLRWAGKWNHYRDRPTQLVAAVVWLFHFGYAGILALTLLTGNLLLLAFLAAAKMLPEAILIRQSLRKGGMPFHWGAFLLLQLVYSPYVVLTGLFAIASPSYSWKGRPAGKVTASSPG